MYLNTIYLGHTCHGVKTAATTYFGKMSPARLAGMRGLVWPDEQFSIYDPHNYPDRVEGAGARSARC